MLFPGGRIVPWATEWGSIPSLFPPGWEDPQHDELLAVLAVTIEQAAEEGTGGMDGTEIRRAVEENAGASVLDGIEQVADKFLLPARARLGRQEDGGAIFLDLRLPFGILGVNLDQQVTALTAPAVAAHFVPEQAFVAAVGIMLAVFVEIVAFQSVGHAGSVAAGETQKKPLATIPATSSHHQAQASPLARREGVFLGTRPVLECLIRTGVDWPMLLRRVGPKRAGGLVLRASVETTGAGKARSSVPSALGQRAA